MERRAGEAAPLSLDAFLNLHTCMGMKRNLSLLLALLVLTLVLPQRTQADPRERITAGDTVAAQWSDGNYYIGKVKGAEGDGFHIIYEDGDELTVKPAHIFVMRSDSEFRVGDHVMAVWMGARMFPGVVSAVNADTCVVKWDDGDTPLEVKKGRMTLWAVK